MNGVDITRVTSWKPHPVLGNVMVIKYERTLTFQHFAIAQPDNVCRRFCRCIASESNRFARCYIKITRTIFWSHEWRHRWNKIPYFSKIFKDSNWTRRLTVQKWDHLITNEHVCLSYLVIQGWKSYASPILYLQPQDTVLTHRLSPSLHAIGSLMFGNIVQTELYE